MAGPVVYLPEAGHGSDRLSFVGDGLTLPLESLSMRGKLLALALIGLAGSTSVRADGLLIPTDRTLPPLSLTYQRVEVTVVGQVATTKVEQSYHNSTDRDLEAEYIFPLPPGLGRDFSMWVGGKRYRGEAVDSSKARETYEDIVRRLKDPGLLENIGRDLWKMRIYPVPRRGEQKIEITFTSILPIEEGMISYRYLLRTGQPIRTTVKDFTMVVRIQNPDPLGPIYSPSHDVAIDRRGERAAVVSFERNACKLDKDFQLYFVPTAERVGFSLLTRRESPADRGYFLLLLSPGDVAGAGARTARPRAGGGHVREHGRREAAAGQGGADPHPRLARARRPLRDDRILHHAEILPPRTLGVDRPRPARARGWVANLEATGGTDISAALEAALRLRTKGHPVGSSRSSC